MSRRTVLVTDLVFPEGTPALTDDQVSPEIVYQSPERQEEKQERQPTIEIVEIQEVEARQEQRGRQRRPGRRRKQEVLEQEQWREQEEQAGQGRSGDYKRKSLFRSGDVSLLLPPTLLLLLCAWSLQ